MKQKSQIILELAEKLEGFGFTVYIAKRGNYGVFTDEQKTRVISFQYNNFDGLIYTGNYKGIGCNIGSGWRIDGVTNKILSKAEYKNMLYSSAPHWATNGCSYKFKTLKEYMDFYGNQYNLDIDTNKNIPENTALTGTQNQLR